MDTIEKELKRIADILGAKNETTISSTANNINFEIKDGFNKITTQLERLNSNLENLVKKISNP